MKVAQAKIEMIKPDEVNMEDYEASTVIQPFHFIWGKVKYLLKYFREAKA